MGEAWSELASFRIHLIRDEWFICDDWDIVAGPFRTELLAQLELKSWWQAEEQERQNAT